MDPKKYLEKLFWQALDKLSPGNVVQNNLGLSGDKLQICGRQYDIADRPLYVLAVGKASIPMATGLLEVVGERVAGLLVITPAGSDVPEELRDKTLFGSHPVPDEQSLNAGKRAAKFFNDIPPGALVLTLISGGTSSLMCLPAEEISIDDLNKTFQLLNNSGARIDEMNTVRKHCSQIKGGQLLRYADSSVTLVDLVISDVPDDNLSIIGSGPTTIDPTTFQDVYHVLLEYDLWDRIPKSVCRHVEMGITGETPDTLKMGEDPVQEHHAHVISSARRFAEEIAEFAGKDKYNSFVADKAYNEDVEEVAAQISEKVLSVNGESGDPYPPAVLVFYGESTVNVTGEGKGGRNQELALRGALRIAGREHITWLSAGTDGIDGPTDAAGAIVDGTTLQEAEEKGLDPDKYLQKNDSYHFHEQLGTLLKTGPTGNNLMDIVIVFVENPG